MLESLTDGALETGFEVFGVKLPTLEEGAEYKDIARIGNMKLSAMKTVLNTQLRVDDQRLRRRGEDILPKILEVLAREKLRLISPSSSS